MRGLGPHAQQTMEHETASSTRARLPSWKRLLAWFLEWYAIVLLVPMAIGMVFLLLSGFRI